MQIRGAGGSSSTEHSATVPDVSGSDGVAHVRLFAAAKAAAGTAELDVASGTIDSISTELIAHCSALAQILPACSFLVDGLQASEHAGSTPVGTGSVLDVLPPFAGG